MEASAVRVKYMQLVQGGVPTLVGTAIPSVATGLVTSMLLIAPRERHTLTALIVLFNLRLTLQAFDRAGHPAGMFMVTMCTCVLAGYIVGTIVRPLLLSADQDA